MRKLKPSGFTGLVKVTASDRSVIPTKAELSFKSFFHPKPKVLSSILTITPWSLLLTYLSVSSPMCLLFCMTDSLHIMMEDKQTLIPQTVSHCLWQAKSKPALLSCPTHRVCLNSQLYTSQFQTFPSLMPRPDLKPTADFHGLHFPVVLSSTISIIYI